MKDLVLSVVFPTYNRPEEVEITLSKLREFLTVPYEVIMVDNSPEPHKFDLKENERQIPMGENLGTAARNVGIKEAQGQYILMLDDDSHPQAGAVEKAIELLESSPGNTGGINSRVERLDGGRENPPLLPTVFHGCGVIFKSEVVKHIDKFYPEDFCFYGEEYWSTLLLYKAGFRFIYSDDFRVCHRMSNNGRDKAKILYHLTVNNRRTWEPITPEAYVGRAEYDTTRRYELICNKEGVPEAFEKAMKEEIQQDLSVSRMNDKDFEDYSLLSNFVALVDSGELDFNRGVVLCGCGKFPTLWGDYLIVFGIPQVDIADFNPGIAGQDYGRYKVLDKKAAVEKIRSGAQAVCGHSARADTDAWLEYLLDEQGLAPSSIVRLP